MSKSNLLEGIELIPVLELEPATFATRTHKSPCGTTSELPDEWFQYWTDCLADSGITGLRPLRRGSWHVPIVNFDVPSHLQKFLEVTFQEWGGVESLSDPDGKPVLGGGLALRCIASDLLIAPTCCADLGDAKNWKTAADYREVEWQMLWIGHPWLAFRFQAPWLVLSELHEGGTPCERWRVCPDELGRALSHATSELERFAGQLARLLPRLGYRGDPEMMARNLAGLSD